MHAFLVSLTGHSCCLFGSVTIVEPTPVWSVVAYPHIIVLWLSIRGVSREINVSNPVYVVFIIYTLGFSE